MRLTLRTLLAWLDDTLPPAEVREIGQQVADSPFAQDLVEKIRRVTRQRRLTVPNGSGADATDPNLVASYLDNQLSPEQVGEFEKRCLTSDVHLAEVASAHQILSLIGQRAKVPAEARHRMYHLIKGREAVGEDVPRTFAPPEDEDLTEPIAPWAASDLPRRPWLDRFGPALAVVALLGVLVWSAWVSVGPSMHPRDRDQLAHVGELTSPATAAKVKESTPKPAEPKNEAETTKAEAKAVADRAEAKPKREASSTPKVESLPVGVVGVLGDTTGIVLRYDEEGRSWKRLEPKASLKAGDRVLALAPYRVPLQVGKNEFELVATVTPAAGGAPIRDTEVRIRADAGGARPRLELVRGRVVIRGTDAAQPVPIGFDGATLQVSVPPGVPVGLERVARRAPGESAPSPTLRIYAPEGNVAIAAGAESATLKGPAAVRFRAPAEFAEKAETPAPPWVSETSTPPLDAELGQQFVQFFKTERGGQEFTASACLAEALDPSNPKEIRRLAVAGLAALGNELDIVAQALNLPNDRPGRLAAIEALRAQLATSPDAEKALRAAFSQAGGDEYADQVVRLLKGYTPAEGKDEATLDSLVGLLESSEPALRELALDNLMALTDRDDLGYDPDKPKGKGLTDWKELAHSKSLVPGSKEK
ncbi:MAG TPA: hypothetical protein VG406_20560 [Isosphaeraceae bacterium]|jgi:hypothetical protein|nr:hypothetical protein [Isosphaeraceae bacterium]